MIKGGSPGIGYPSGTGKNPNYAFPTDPDYTKPTWGSTPIEPLGNQTTFTPDTKFITYLHTGSEQTARVVYYNSTMHEVRHAWMPDPLTPNIWNVETVVSGVTAGWVSAAYYQDTHTLGICWYDLSEKNLKYVEKPISGSWGTVELVDTSGHDTGSNCSLAYGPGSGAVPGPGISYYDGTLRQLSYAWMGTCRG